MNNGLRGRYLPALQAWNNARSFAADLVTAYGSTDDELNDVVVKWELHTGPVEAPDNSTLKQIVGKTLFYGGRDTIDTIAREVMDWPGWWDVTHPDDREPFTVNVEEYPELRNRALVVGEEAE